MKNSIIFIITLVSTLLLCHSSYGQSDSRIKAGITLGYNTTNIVFNSASDGQLFRWEPRKTLAVGALANVRLGETWEIQSGVILTERGTTIRPLIDVDTHLWYAEIPLHFRFKRSLGGIFSLADLDGISGFGFIGPYAGYGILAGLSGSDKREAPLKFGANNDYQRVDFGLSLGGGTAIDIDAFSAELHFKYTIGLKDIDADADLRSYVRTSNISLVYYLFR